MYATPELLGMIGMNESHVQRLSRDDFAFTAPWHNGKWVGYIFKTRNSGGLWRFAAPFSPNMWAALVGSIFVFAFLFGSLRVIRTSWDPAANAESGPLGKGAICTPLLAPTRPLAACLTGACGERQTARSTRSTTHG